MKKILLFVVAALLLLATTAMADSIKGKFGVTVLGGLSYIFDSNLTDEGVIYLGGAPDKIERSKAWAGGVGFMYGITDNLAVNFDVIYSQADASITDGTIGVNVGTGKTVDFAPGIQWRFMPKNAFVPYVGAGLDVFWNRLDLSEDVFGPDSSADVDVTYGGHLSAGVDCFFTPNIALNAEIRGVYSTDGDVTFKYPGDPDIIVAKDNPSNISGFVGIRFFFP